MSDLVIKAKPFNLKYTLECGQCFRWNKINENEYMGVISDRVIKISQQDDKLYITSNNKENLEKVVKNYFDLNFDYENVEKQISLIDLNVSQAVKNTTGIRILNQSHFETLISYIISANNNIPRISKSVNDISLKYGKKVEFENNYYYIFPKAEDLKDVTDEDYQKCGVGFRARYIKHTVEDILDGKINLEELKTLKTDTVRTELLNLMGVGPKVADCVLLFSYSRKEVFPVDVWVKRVMEKLYFKKATSLKQISEYSKNSFGKYAGIVQQHLFYNIREGMM